MAIVSVIKQKNQGSRWFFTPFSPYPDNLRLNFPIHCLMLFLAVSASRVYTAISNSHAGQAGLVTMMLLVPDRAGSSRQLQLTKVGQHHSLKKLTVPLPAPEEQGGTGHQPRELCTQTTAVQPDLRTGLQAADKNRN